MRLSKKTGRQSVDEIRNADPGMYLHGQFSLSFDLTQGIVNALEISPGELVLGFPLSLSQTRSWFSTKNRNPAHSCGCLVVPRQCPFNPHYPINRPPSSLPSRAQHNTLTASSSILRLVTPGDQEARFEE